MGQTARKRRQLVQYDDLAARNTREAVRNSGRKQRTGGEPIKSGSRKQRSEREPVGSSSPKQRTNSGTARSSSHKLGSGNRTAESGIQVIGNSRQIMKYTGQEQRGGKRSKEYQDLELWELRREKAPSKQRKPVKSYPRRPGNPRPVQSIRRRRAKRRKVYFYRAIALSVIALCLVLIYFMTGAIYRSMHKDTGKGIVQILSEKVEIKKIAAPEIVEDYLEMNDYSRPGTELKKINSIFVHYTANPGTTAQQNRSYFANLAETKETSASAHFIIGYDGTLLQCIPLDEQAYAVKTRNEDSISIECCYLAEDGSFTQETYDTLIHTLAWLIDEYHLSTDDILRHYDCGGKLCPLYYAEHEDAWEQLRKDVENYENPKDIH